MKLFAVQVEYEIVVLAESKAAAERDAPYAIRYECDVSPDSVFATEITDIEDLPDDWNPNCRPWGHRDPYDRTIGEILSSNNN